MKYVVSFFLLLALAACSRPYQIEAPRDFVVLDRADDFKAISADGVRLLARAIPNNPRGDLNLWSKTILLQLENQGYTVDKQEHIRAASGQPGQLIASHYLIRNVKYAYWTAVFVRDEKILLIESAAPAEDFAKHEAALRRSLTTVRF
jgi:hypothetical protein